MKKQTFLILFLLGVIGAIFALRYDQKRRSSVISVYVHGTLFNWRNLFAAIPLASELTYVPDGLTPVRDLEENAIARCLAHDFCKKDSMRFVYDSFYSFGWSGKLSVEERDKSSKFLAEELVKLVAQREQDFGIRPTIRVITFSHGGNVAFGMAKYLPKDFEVEVICIGCPIQAESEELVQVDCFSKVYVISSLNDIVQVSDPVNIYRNMRREDAKQLLSKRFFDHDMPKIKQACVSVNGTYLGHLELFNMFNKHIPAVINRLDKMPEIQGRQKLHFDVTDRYFRFLNGINFVQVLQGNDMHIASDESEGDIAVIKKFMEK